MSIEKAREAVMAAYGHVFNGDAQVNAIETLVNAIIDAREVARAEISRALRRARAEEGYSIGAGGPAQPAPAAEGGGDLERWGFKDNAGCERMSGGYWTPWHVATARIRELEGERDWWRGVAHTSGEARDEVQDAHEAAEASLAALREVLEWYADKANWANVKLPGFGLTTRVSFGGMDLTPYDFKHEAIGPAIIQAWMPAAKALALLADPPSPAQPAPAAEGETP